MRHLRRLGILAAATTLAGTTALAGAGAAGAQVTINWKTDSPSSVSVERVDNGDLVVSYDNRSGESLFCYSYIGPRAMVEALYDGHVESGRTYPGPQIPEGEWLSEIGVAMEADQWAPGVFIVDADASGPVTFLFPENGEGPLVPTPLEQPGDKTFAPSILTACAAGMPAEPGDTVTFEYIELEKFVAASDDDDQEDPVEAVDWRTDSPSEVSVNRGPNGDLIVSYENRSNRALVCVAFVGPHDMVEALYENHVQYGFDPQAQQEWLDTRDVNYYGQWTIGVFVTRPGDSGPATYVMIDDEDQLIPYELEQPADKTFSPAVLSACGDWSIEVIDEELGYGIVDVNYLELEKFFSNTGDDDDSGDGGQPQFDIISWFIEQIDVFGSID